MYHLGVRPDDDGTFRGHEREAQNLAVTIGVAAPEEHPAFAEVHDIAELGRGRVALRRVDLDRYVLDWDACLAAFDGRSGTALWLLCAAHWWSF
jgi:hypothetical protein